MPRRCGCATAKCFCAFDDSDTVKWTGTGTAEDPFTPNAQFGIEVADTSTLDLDLTSTEEGLMLSAQPLGGADIQVFTSGIDTWTKPAGVHVVRAIMIGGGGGGAGGGYLNTGSTIRYGGGGGMGGSVTTITILADFIPASAPVNAAPGGAGGASISSGSFSGHDGGDGGISDFYIYRAGGGIGGKAAVDGGGGQTDQMALDGMYGTAPGQPGANPITNADAATYGVFIADGRVRQDWPYFAPAGGGSGLSLIPSGGGYATPGAYCLPGKGARSAPVADINENGLDELVTRMGSSGGGGVFGHDGGNGGKYGGGGGGGGYGIGGTPSGKGGNGGGGIVIVMAW